MSKIEQIQPCVIVTVLRRIAAIGVMSTVLVGCVASVGKDFEELPDAGTGGGDAALATPTIVTVTVPGRPTDPAMFSYMAAYQDGAGEWQVAPAPTGDTYTFPISSPTWGFAVTCRALDGGTMGVQFSHFSTAEKTSLMRPAPASCSAPTTTYVSLSGTVSNIPSTLTGLSASYPASFDAVEKPTTTTGVFQFSDSVVAGSHDLLITRETQSTTAVGSYVSAAAIVRNVTAPATGVVANWNTASIKSAAITVTNPGGTVSVATALHSAGGTYHSFAAQSSTATTGTLTFQTSGLAAAQTVAGDVYVQRIAVTGNGWTDTVENWTGTVAPLTYSPSARLGGVLASVSATLPYPQIKMQWNRHPNAVGYHWTSRQGSVSWGGVFGAGYLGASPEFQTPDLSALPGWSSAFAFKTGTPIDGIVIAMLSSRGIDELPYSSPAPIGTQRALVTSIWSVVP